MAQLSEEDTARPPAIWKVAPGEKAYMWEECREAGCITINWLNGRDFSDLSKRDIKSALSKQEDGRGGTPYIWRFVHRIQRGDVIVANNGHSRIVGIGRVTTEYLPPNHPKNPRRGELEHLHARRVEWVIKEQVDLREEVFARPTVLPVSPGQWGLVRRAYLKLSPEYEVLMDALVSGSARLTCEQAEDIEETAENDHIGPTTKKVLNEARLGQGWFRDAVLKRWGHCCAATSAVTVRAIRASHIKPWKESTNKERLDPDNGLPLVATLDALFDAGLISFDAAGQMLVSPALTAAERKVLGIGNLSLGKKPTPKMAAYLVHHREKHGFAE